MSYQNLIVENQDGIILITLNREKALNDALKAELESLLKEFKEKHWEA